MHFLFGREEYFQVVSGPGAMVVGAPHHGTRPNVKADMDTGPIALAVARELEARAVIVSNLRSKVDVNKNPLLVHGALRSYAIRYQNEIFQSNPSLVIEFHGHNSGKYPIEISTGFDLDAHFAGDRLFLERLQLVKQNLPARISAKLGTQPEVGVYPLDRDVVKTATNTFTFQKIRQARNLAGLERYGLHIELAPEFRSSRQAKTQPFLDALAGVFSAVISEAFLPLPGPEALISPRVDREGDGDIDSLPRIRCSVAMTPENALDQKAALLCHADLEKLGMLDGDRLVVRFHGEELRMTARASAAVQKGQVALQARFRHQLGVKPRDVVEMSAEVSLRAPVVESDSSTNPYFALGAPRPNGPVDFWLNPSDVERNQLQGRSQIGVRKIRSQGGALSSFSTDERVPLRTIIPTEACIRKFPDITYGELLMIEAQNENSPA